MSLKSTIAPVQVVGSAIKTFFSKLVENPGYHNIKYYSKYKHPEKNRNRIW